MHLSPAAIESAIHLLDLGPSESEVQRDPEERRGVTISRSDVVRPPRLELGTPGLEGSVPVTEAVSCQQVARAATRMCHAVDPPRVGVARAHTPIGKHGSPSSRGAAALSRDVERGRVPATAVGSDHDLDVLIERHEEP